MLWTMKLLPVLWLGVLSLAFIAPASAAPTTPLDDYVTAADDAYKVEVTQRTRVGDVTAIGARLTSQQWRGKVWKHDLSLLIPDKLRHTDAAVLVILGGVNGQPAPKLDSPAAAALLAATRELGAVVVVLQQVPNQPLLGDRYEDALIARTFREYLDHPEAEGVDTWPLLLPMTKSAVRAMDAAQEIAKSEAKLDLKRFVVTGASKRGWTTYLTAAADERVAGIVPMVIDMPNLPAQMRQQLSTYGRFSQMIEEYQRENVMSALLTPRGQKLVSMVDPYAYRERLTMPKLIALGTNDPYWTVDSSGLYFDALPEPKALLYSPGSGHGIGLPALPTVVAFIDAALSGETLPQLTWKREGGAVNVSWSVPPEKNAAKATGAVLWEARAADRDFRQATWSKVEESEAVEGVSVRFDLAEPAKGWSAHTAEVKFLGSDGKPFSLWTQMFVLPEAFPHEPRAAAMQRGSTLDHPSR